MGMLNNEVREATQKKSEDGLVNPVSLVFITQEPGRLVLPDRIKGQECQTLQALEKDIRIQVFVTPTCPCCTMVVRLAHQFAMESPRVRGEMVEATEFPHLAQKYHVFGVPKTVINENVFIEGAVPEPVFLEHVLQAAGHSRK